MNQSFNDCIIKISHIVDRHADTKWCLEGQLQGDNLILLYEGEAYVESNGEGQIVKSGDLVHFTHGVYRKGYTFAENPMKCVAISYELLYYNKQKGELERRTLPLEFVQTINSPFIFNKLKQIIKNMVGIWQSNSPYRYYDINSEFNLLLKELLRWVNTETFDYTAVQKVEQVIDYLNNYIDKQIQIDDISASMGISNSYISRIFKKYTGMTIISYFNKIKIEKSKDYLACGYSVTKCSEALGFKDVYYFSKVFRQYEGICPSDYAKSFV